MNFRSFCVVPLLTVALAVSEVAVAVTVALPLPNAPAANRASEPAAQHASDIVAIFSSASEERSKFLSQGYSGFADKLIRWRYNDAGRNAAISASAADAKARLQTAMNKWSSACGISFQFDGDTTLPAGLATNQSDGVSVIAWGPLAGGLTGVTYVAASGPAPSGPFTLNEADMVINNQFNPNADVTMLHEIGHMLGLNHSNVQNTVMSGPPQTLYASLTTLTADDIAGCQSLYGAPVATNVAISGTISNGAAIAGVTFCARPAAGVSCTASNASGAYSCTVPFGWTGTLFSPSVSNNRIPPQAFSNVTAATTRNVTGVSGVPACNLDVDNNGLIEAATDGVAILRRMMGEPVTAFDGLAGTCAANTTGAAIFDATTSNYNVTGGASTLPATDGLVILRAMSGRTGTDVTNGLGLTRESGATNTTWAQLQSWLNGTCGSNF